MTPNRQMKTTPPGNCLMNHRILRIKNKLFRLSFQIFRSPRGNLSLLSMRKVRVWKVWIARLVMRFIRRKIIIMIRRDLEIFKMALFLMGVCQTLIVCFTKLIVYQFNSKIHFNPLALRKILKKLQKSLPSGS